MTIVQFQKLLSKFITAIESSDVRIYVNVLPILCSQNCDQVIAALTINGTFCLFQIYL